VREPAGRSQSGTTPLKTKFFRRADIAFLKVIFFEEGGVLVNGKRSGKTNLVMQSSKR
jgi:hypothetical protein